MYWKTTNVPQPDFWIIYNGNGDETLQRTDMTWNAQIRTLRTCVLNLSSLAAEQTQLLQAWPCRQRDNNKTQFKVHITPSHHWMRHDEGPAKCKTSLSTTQYNQTYCKTQRRIANINKVTNHSIENTQLRTLDVESSQLQNLFAFHH